MAYLIDPCESPQSEIRRIAGERLGDALERLDAVIGGDDVDIEAVVHEVRKRCKETRGLARLVQPALGDEFRPFDRLVRGGANQLSAFRDAHALLATFESLLAAQPGHADDQLRSVRDRQAALAAAATAAIESGDERIVHARTVLAEALERSQQWTIPDRFAPIGGGLEATYGLGRRSLRTAQRKPTDRHVHEWRKAVKYLWYQARLLRAVAPSVIEPLVDQLDALSDALGDDHDLAVLVAQLDAEPDHFGDALAVDHARTLARAQQDTLRAAAFRAGATIYVESSDVFRRRVRGYWRATANHGAERLVGGIAALAAAEQDPDAGPPSVVERERKFLVTEVPPELDLSDRVEMRQGYLVTGERVSVRVRDAGTGGRTLTIKAGRHGGGAERTELEWKIAEVQFDAVWPLTEGRRVVKTRHRIPSAGHVIELDVFGEHLDGLVVAEVEFSSMPALEAFEPPAWFGLEVTDDERYNNAALAIDGLPPTPFA